MIFEQWGSRAKALRRRAHLDLAREKAASAARLQEAHDEWPRTTEVVLRSAEILRRNGFAEAIIASMVRSPR